MKNFRRFSVLTVLAIAMAACNANTTQIIDQVQAAAVAICAFEPTAATIAALISGGVSAPASTIAAGICSAVTAAPKASAETAAPWVYPGTKVVIHGSFVSKGPHQ